MLSISTAIAISNGQIKGTLHEDIRQKIRRNSAIVGQIASADKAVYGINTGFGPLCTTMISAEDTKKLQENLLKSHAVGLGKPISDSLARLMLVLKLQALAQGYSGIREETVDRIIWHLDNEVTPLVPCQGSVGASGDLAPLSHLFLPLIGLGTVQYNGQCMEARAVLQLFGLQPLTLGPKEGLALTNGTQFIAAHAVQVVQRFQNLLANANLVGGMMLEGLMGSGKPFLAELHQLRPYAGNQHVAATIHNLLHASEINRSHANCTRVQDPYSLRCIPPVHGAATTAWLHLKELVAIEINAVTDNPVIINESLTISGGNFHGEPLALPLDYACLAASEIGAISDRRIYLSLEGDTPGVPKLLFRETGLNSGFMILQYTSAALASENKGLCFPASADSIPTSLGQEDHVSMGSISGRKALQVIENAEKIIGIELMCAAQALDFHLPLKPGRILQVLHAHVRQFINHVEQDQLLYESMQRCIDIVQRGDLPRLARDHSEAEELPYATPFSAVFDQF